MALINCPECNKGMSDTLKKCPHCGFKIKKKSSKKKMSKKKLIIIISIVCAIIIGIVIFIIIDSNSSSYTEVKSEEDIVRDQIKISLQARAAFYNDQLSYSSHSISRLNEVKENEYEANGYLYFRRQASEKKWQTDFNCKCNYYEVDKSASCSCDVGSSARMIP